MSEPVSERGQPGILPKIALITGVVSSVFLFALVVSEGLNVGWVENHIGTAGVLILLFFGPFIVTLVPAGLWLLAHRSMPRAAGGRLVVWGLLTTMIYFGVMVARAFLVWHS